MEEENDSGQISRSDQRSYIKTEETTPWERFRSIEEVSDE
jgi:hypothetical protein